MNFGEIETFRRSADARAYSQGWLDAQVNGDAASDFHMNLLAWTSTDPGIVLGIVLCLLDLVANDDVLEAIAMGPVEWLVENSPVDFAPVLAGAIHDHTGLNLATRWKRKHLAREPWIRLAAEVDRLGGD